MTTVLDDTIVEGIVRSTLQGLLSGTVAEMPEACEKLDGQLVLCTGEYGEYRKNTFFLCVKDGSSYSWYPLLRSLDELQERVSHAVQDTLTVNGHALTGDVVLTASDVGAVPDTTLIPTRIQQLINDGVWIDQDVSTLANYFTKQQTSNILSKYLKKPELLDVLPEDAEDGLYAVKDGNSFAAYLVVGGASVRLG